jgi:hypothetical protein
MGRRKPTRWRPGPDKLVCVKITRWGPGEWGVHEHYRDENGDWFHGRPLRIEKKPPAASVNRRRKALVPA